MYKSGGYTILKRKEIDEQAWNACLDSCSYALPYAYPWWLDLVSPGWQGLVLDRGGCYEGVFPIPVVKKFGVHIVRQPVFGHQLGWFRQGERHPPESELRDIIRIIGHHYRYIDRLAIHAPELSSMSLEPARNYLLDLSQPYEKLMAAYAGNRRREITNARKLGLLVNETTDPGPMLEVFKKYIAPGIYGITGEEFPMFLTLFEKWKEAGRVSIYEIKNKESWLAGCMLLRWRNRLIYIFNASTPEGKHLDALSMLIDDVIRRHAGAGEPLFFDFEAPLAGSVRDYYRRFGSKEEQYLLLSRNNLPAVVKWLQRIRKKWVQRNL